MDFVGGVASSDAAEDDGVGIGTARQWSGAVDTADEFSRSIEPGNGSAIQRDDPRPVVDLNAATAVVHFRLETDAVERRFGDGKLRGPRNDAGVVFVDGPL